MEGESPVGGRKIVRLRETGARAGVDVFGTTVEHGGQGGDEKGKSDSGGMVGLLAHGALKVPELLENGIELSVEGREAAGDCGEHVACRAGLVELPEHGRNEKRLNAGTLKVFLENLRVVVREVSKHRDDPVVAPRKAGAGTRRKALQALVELGDASGLGRKFDEAAPEVGVHAEFAEHDLENPLKVPVGAHETREVAVVVEIVLDGILLVVGIRAGDDGRGGNRAPDDVERDDERIAVVSERSRELANHVCEGSALGGRVTVEGFRIVGKVSDGLDGSLQNVVVFSRQAECGDDGGGSAVDVRIEGAQRFGKRLVGGQNGGSRELGGRFGLRYLHGESFD